MESDTFMDEKIDIFGMTCMHCHKRVTDAISKVNGVRSVDVSLENSSATVEFDEGTTSLDAIKQAVIDVGYEVGEKPILKPDSEPEQSARSFPVINEDETPEDLTPKNEPDTTVIDSATVEFNEGTTSLDAIKQAVVVAGHEVGIKSIPEPDSEPEQSARSFPVIIKDEEKTTNYPVLRHEPGTNTNITVNISGMACTACAVNLEKTARNPNGSASSTVTVSVSLENKSGKSSARK